MQKLIGTHHPAEQIAEGKRSQLRALQQEMLQHCSSEKSVDSDDWLDAAYLIYCKHFRSYFVENYPTSTYTGLIQKILYKIHTIHLRTTPTDVNA